MTSGRPLPRKLHTGHFAFMRALAQGLDERDSWDRYLRLEGEHTDLHIVRKTIGWIRNEFAAAARRERKSGAARLVLLDTRRIAGQRSFRAWRPARFTSVQIYINRKSLCLPTPFGKYGRADG